MAEKCRSRIPTREETHREARQVKDKLGLTWDRFVQKATEELDSGDDD